MADIERLQKRICRMYRTEYTPPEPGSNLGIALSTMEQEPIEGVRLQVEKGTCGWYIHGGEYLAADDFCDSLCVDHVFERCRLALPFLGLPPGWRFRTDTEGTFEAWFDAAVLS